MSRWLRWQGLVAFLLLVGGLAVVWVLFIDNWVESLIEHQGSAMMGAKVELDSVELQLWPTTATLNGLQVTDPDEPMRNLLQADVIQLSIDAVALIEEKLIIENMSIEGMGFMEPRETSGALDVALQQKTDKDESNGLGFVLPKLEIPSAEELIKAHEFKTVTQAKQLKVKVEDTHDKWKNVKNDLPDKTSIENYKQRLDKIKQAKGTIEKLAAVKQLKQLKKDIKRDIKKINTVRETFKADITSLKTDYRALKKTSKDEVNGLVTDLGLDSGSLGGIGRAIIGKQFSAYLDQGLGLYSKAKPLLDQMGNSEPAAVEERQQRSTGVYVDFVNAEPVPEFLIETAKLTGQANHSELNMRFNGVITDVTNQPEVLQKPTLMTVKAELPDAEHIQLDATLNHIDPTKPRDDFSLVMNKVNIKNFPLSEDSEFPVSLDHAKSDVTAQLVITGDTMMMQTDAAFSDVAITVPVAGDISSFKQAVIDAFASVQQFDVAMSATGALLQPDIAVDTNIDEPIKKAIGASIEKQVASLKAKLQTEFNEQLSVHLKDIDTSISSLNGLDGDFNQQLSGLNKLLKLN